MKPPSPELRALIDRVLDEEPLAKSDVARLEELLKDKEALRYYTRMVSQESMLAEALRGIELELDGPPENVVRFPLRALALAAAACVVFALGFFSGRGGKSPEVVADAAPRVQVTGLMGVEWEEHAGPDLLSGAAVADRVAFRSGLVELTYASGVRLTLEGPADFRVRDAASGRLDKGKLVAYVPKGAEGFTVDYAQGRIVDLGTEFAMDLSGDQAEVGVFDGEIELYLPDSKQPRALFQSQAVMHDPESKDGLKAIPLNREKFVRRMPSRDFRWSVTSPDPQELEFDVTHLVWKPSRYRAVFKWVDGMDAILVSDAELRLDGRRVALDAHEGATGSLWLVRDNVFELDVDPALFARGRWTLHAKVLPYPRVDGMEEYAGPIESQGILQFEEGLVQRATASDFIGKWSYHYLGSHYVREFLADGTVSLSKDGEPMPTAFVDSRWEVENGVLSVWIPDQRLYERHVLRDRRTLVFISNRYDNAVRLEEK